MKKLILLISLLSLLSFSGYSQSVTNSNGKAPLASGDENASTTALTATPKYPGGDRAFLKFISKNLNYPQKAREEKIQGQVTVRFQVDADGSVKDAMVPTGKGIGSGCDEEAVRVVMLSPKWKPGVRNGAPTALWYEVPIAFSLSEMK